MENGWIKLYRSSMDWEWYKTPNMFLFFTHCLMLANHKEGKWQGVDIKPGQFVTGRKQLSAQTGLSEQSIRTCITRLKSTNEITIKSTKQYSIITIVKWEDYQSSNQPSNQQLTNDQPTINQQSTTNNNDKNDNNEKNDKEEDKPPSADSNRFIKPNTEEIKAYFKSIDFYRPNLEIRFFDFYESKGWKVGKNAMKDWKAACRTWKNKSGETDKPPSDYAVDKTLEHLKYLDTLK